MLIQSDLTIAAAGIACRLFAYYNESSDKGLFKPAPVADGFLWWQTPVALDVLSEYEQMSGDFSNHHLILESFRKNRGDDHGIFSPPWGGIGNDEKNDDMLWWTLASLQSGEQDLLQAAQKSHDHVRRFWAAGSACGCEGGIRWSADPSHPGWSYLNSVTNGQFFLASAILTCETKGSQYTVRQYGRPDGTLPHPEAFVGLETFTVDGSDYYQEWAERSFNWMRSTELISPSSHAVYDGTHESSCLKMDTAKTDQWSYNIALQLRATAVMFSNTADRSWLDHHDAFKDHILDHFQDGEGLIYEPLCDPSGCGGDDWRVFLGILASCIGRSYQISPDRRMRDLILRTASRVLIMCERDWSCSQQISRGRDSSGTAADFKLQDVNAATQHANRDDRALGYIQDQIVALAVVNAALLVL